MSRKAWTLPSILQELKMYPRKTCGYRQPRSHLILVLNERSVNDARRFLSSVASDSQISLIVSETHFSCNTVDRGLWLAILSSLLCPETESEVMYFILLILRSDVLTLHTPNANMADHSVGARDESHESEVSQALMFCFDNASPEKS